MSISLHVEGIAGGTVSQIAQEMVALANRVNIMVTCDVNRCHIIAMPGDRPKDVERQYDVWLELRTPTTHTESEKG